MRRSATVKGSVAVAYVAAMAVAPMLGGDDEPSDAVALLAFSLWLGFSLAVGIVIADAWALALPTVVLVLRLAPVFVGVMPESYADPFLLVAFGMMLLIETLTVGAGPLVARLMRSGRAV